MQLAGFSPIPSALAGMLIWAAHFGLIYAVNAVACARGIAGQRLLGLPFVSLLVLGLTALALAAVGLIGLRAWLRLGNGLAGAEGESRFMLCLTLHFALLSALAILWESLPAFLVSHCA